MDELVFNFGTIFLSSDIVTEADPSAFVSLTTTGRSERFVFDRRTDSFNTIDARLFEATYSDGLTLEVQVNPEFSAAAAEAEARFYAEKVGQLPTLLRTDVAALWIHQGVELFGGGNNSILIHTGQGEVYIDDGILEETLIHEATHTSLDARFASSPGYLAAREADPAFISGNARNFPDREDLAETFLLYLAITEYEDRLDPDDVAAIRAGIPNRIAFFDQQNLDLGFAVTEVEMEFDQSIIGTSVGEVLVGTGGADSIEGQGGADRLVGRGDNDHLDGGGGKDTLIGGGGSDTLLGRGGRDDLRGGGGADDLEGGGGSDTLNGAGGTDIVAGGGGRDLVRGGGGRDMLEGGGGRDTLEGGRGLDVLAGGGGADEFMFTRGDGRDVIEDFQQGRDRIAIDVGADEFQDLIIAQAGDDVVISFSNVEILVEGDRVGNFTAADFIF